MHRTYKKGKLNLKINAQKAIVTNYNFGEKGASNGKNCDRRYMYIISVRNPSETIGRAMFKFYGSLADHQKGKDRLTPYDLGFCLYCFASDAISGLMLFEEFCNEFGYDPDSIRAKKIHDECTNSYRKMKNIGLDENDLYKILNDEKIQ